MHERARLDWQGKRNNQRQIYMSDRYDIEFACGASQEVKEYVSEYLTYVINSMKKLSEQRGFSTVYLVQPSEDDVTSNHPERVDKGCENYDPINLVSFFSDLLVNHKVINLFHKFFGCTKCYFTKSELGGDNHWSPYGVSLAASEVVDYILTDVVQ